jgi:HNH endonuclease
MVGLLTDFESELKRTDLRKKVQALIPAYHLLRDLGSSLIPEGEGASGRDRILSYLRKYPITVIKGDELMVVAGIGDWARRVRELRVEFGWAIVNGKTAKEMAKEGDFPIDDIDATRLGPDDYILMNEEVDRDAAYRWRVANEIRKQKHGVRGKILEYMRRNLGKPITGEELRYIANDKSEWARRVRELRTQLGWPVATKSTGRPDLPVGVYILEQDRQSPPHDRTIKDPVRRQVLRRDGYTCVNCKWNHSLWNPSDPRHLELHHVEHHARGGKNDPENLITLCTVCHDDEHRHH